MSYVEHGPRIFLAGKSSNGIPLIYGDYILSKKRSEGRLKTYDSCSDIRAWSLNPLENLRYFHEITERTNPAGKIIPFNVVIDNIIGLTSQAQNELRLVRKELEKYKSLKLTPEQKKHLWDYDNMSVSRLEKESISKLECTTIRSLSKNTSDKPLSVTQSEPYISTYVYPEESMLSDKSDTYPLSKNEGTMYLQSSKIFDINPLISDNSNSLLPLKSIYASSNVRIAKKNDKEESRFHDKLECYSEKLQSAVEYVDASLQVNEVMDVNEIGVQINITLEEYTSNKPIRESIRVASQTSFDSKYSDENSSSIERKEKSPHTEMSYTSTDNESVFDSEATTESEFEMREKAHKAIIIEKDSEIIALKNELGAKEAELEELRELSKKLETSLKEKEETLNVLRGSLKLSQEKLMGMGEQRSQETEDLKKKLCACGYLIEQLKEELDRKYQLSYLQSQEIEKLKVCGKEAVALRNENDTLIKKIKEAEHLTKEVEKYSSTLEQLGDALQEKDELQKQNREQCCILADQENEIKRLLTLINQMSIAHSDRQVKMKGIVDNLRAEVQEKNHKISQCEEQLLCMEREISELTVNLKNSINNLDEFKIRYESICNCAKCDRGSQAKIALCSLNALMAELHGYKVERRELLQHIRHLQHVAGDSRHKGCCSHSINKFSLSQNIDLELIPKENRADATMLSIKGSESNLNNQRNDGTNETVDEESVYNSISCEDCTNSKEAIDVDTWQGVKELNGTPLKQSETQASIPSIKDIAIDEVDEVGMVLSDQASIKLSNISVQLLIDKLQEYIENERPSLTKQIRILRKALENVDADNEEIIIQKDEVVVEKVQEFYNQRKKEYEKYKARVKELPDDLFKIRDKLDDSVETILYEQLEEILRLEEIFSYDEEVDRVLTIHMRCSIDKIHELSTVLQDAGDQQVKMRREITKQKHEIQRKDAEIFRLKEQAAERGEGDCALRNSKKLIEEQLNATITKLNEKDDMIKILEERLRSMCIQLSAYNEERVALQMENKDFNNIKNTLLKENEKKDNQLSHTMAVVENLEKHTKDMESKLNKLHNENDNLKNNLNQAKKTLEKNNESILELKEREEKNRNALERKSTEHEIKMKGKLGEIAQLQNENIILNEKLKENENKISQMNETIETLSKKQDEIDIIHVVQENISRVDADKKKLETEINNFKAEYINYQNRNMKLEDELHAFSQRNNSLQKYIESLKNKNDELSRELFEEKELKEKLKHRLYDLSNKICDRIMTIKKRASDINHNESTFSSVNAKQDQIKTTRLELLEKLIDLKKSDASDRLFNVSEDMVTKDENNIPSNEKEDNYKLKHLKNQNKQSLAEIQKLMFDIENRDLEIKNLKEHINRLVWETNDLQSKLKLQKDEYQNNLVVLKKKYDSSISALRKRHNESVERLQARFEDIMKGELFDSESWLRSLNLKELAELHNRICVLSSCMDNESEREDCYSDVQKNNLYENSNEFNSRSNLNDDKSYLQDNQQRENIRLGDHKNIVPEMKIRSSPTKTHAQFLDGDATEKYFPSEIYSYIEDYKQEFEYFEEGQKLVSKDVQLKSPIKSAKNDNFDWQRKNFIYQCSIHHKLGNAV